jgi:ubiquinone/menaquinone biosynthesis C-methylase UbiE
MSKYVDESKLNEEDLWNWCLLEYQSSNYLVKKLIDNYYEKIKQIVLYFGKDDRILEVGCGAAESSEKIKNLIGERCFEISEFDQRYVNMVKKNRPDFANTITQESVYELKRGSNEFDCIFMLEVLEHLENVELALTELFRVSKKYVIIAVPNEPLWRILNILRFKYFKDLGNTPGHLNHWSKRKLKRLLSNYGDVIKIYKPLPWLIAVVKVKN